MKFHSFLMDLYEVSLGLKTNEKEGYQPLNIVQDIGNVFSQFSDINLYDYYYSSSEET